MHEPSDEMRSQRMVEILERPPAPSAGGAGVRFRPRWRSVLLRGVIGLVAFLVLGNGVILGATTWFQWSAAGAAPAGVPIAKVRVVDDNVYRGAAPTAEGLRELAGLGVTTVVDLRAEADLEVAEDVLEEVGMRRVHLPIRDGQLPSEEQTAAFLEIVHTSPGRVFLHCGAGVGRTGAMSAFYLNATGQADGAGALRHNLSVGPPSLEQMAFSLTTRNGGYDRPGRAVTALSRVLDGPRRMWHNLT
jgi:protein-tyrosine phosphatase